MSRVVVRKLGNDIPSGLDQLAVEPVDPEVCTAEVPKGHVLVRVHAAAVNFPDLLMTHGGYQYKPQLPYTPGTEASGVIERCGPGVQGLAEGDRVICGGRSGMMAAFAIAPAWACTRLPSAFTFSEGAAFNVTYATAYHGLIERARLEPSDTVLVNGAAGGVGLAAVQIARAVGCGTIIGTGTSKEKLEIVMQMGASAVIDLSATPESSLADAVKRLTGGRGVDVVYDPVGGAVFEQSLRATAWGARVAIIGFAGGDNARSARANYTLIKGLSILGCRAGESVARGSVDPVARAEQLGKWVVAGKLKPYVSHSFDVSEVKHAFQALSRRLVVGKAVVTFAQDVGPSKL